MVRHYSQDITPDDGSEKEMPVPASRARSIRDFRPSAARVKLQAPPRMPERPPEYEHEEVTRRSRWGVWIAAIIALIVLAVAALFVFFPSTSITVTPHTHTMTFDTSNPLTAYPAASATAGTIAYTVISQVFDDSAVVQANGTEHAEEKATGNITVFNETAKQARLIKNTRFQNSAGLIFRIPASVDVPAAKGTAPGTINVTVFADQTGPKYNVNPDTFNVPGLKSSPEYSKVYAKSTAAFTGGFSGDRPAVSPAVLESSKAEVRNRLTEKANELQKTAPQGSLTFPGLAAIAFETLAPTSEAGGGVRIHERATVTIPVFPTETFAHAVAQAVSADAEGQSVSIRFGEVTAQPVGALNGPDLGVQAITFTVAGRGQLIWNVDTKALAEALAGRSETAFQAIIKGFPAIEEARARITPFWRHAFPQDATTIKVILTDPAADF